MAYNVNLIGVWKIGTVYLNVVDKSCFDNTFYCVEQNWVSQDGVLIGKVPPVYMKKLVRACQINPLLWQVTWFCGLMQLSVFLLCKNSWFVQLIYIEFPRTMRKPRRHLKRLLKDKRWSDRNPFLYLEYRISFTVCHFLTKHIFCDWIRQWDAAKHMESAAALAKELGKWNEVSDFYKRASELYLECGRSQPASDALGRGARWENYFQNLKPPIRGGLLIFH